MKITIDFEGLENQIKDAASKNTQSAIYSAIESVAKEYIVEHYQECIEKSAEALIEQSINNYLNSHKIAVGNPFSGEEVKEYTPTEYVNKVISDIFEEQKLTVKDTSGWNTTNRKITFDEYVKRTFDYEGAIKKQMDNFALELKNRVSTYMKNTYDKALQDTLCSTLVDVMMTDEHFKQVNDKIKHFGD